MITLGHIAYANCFPIHGPLLLGDLPFDGEIVTGEPSRLNRLLATGRVQLAPCSSIEYARQYPRYRIVPEVAIGSRGAARSILLASREHPECLHRRRVGLPTASASSAVLAQILLARRYEATAEFGWFDQVEEDPFERFDAALLIGDAALGTHRERPELFWTDLGRAWTEWTGLPFVYALWQVHAAPGLDEAVADCCRVLLESKALAFGDLDALADRYPGEFPPGRAELPGYWRALEYALDTEACEGLIAFYAMAADVGQLERVPPLHFFGEVAAPTCS